METVRINNVKSKLYEIIFKDGNSELFLRWRRLFKINRVVFFGLDIANNTRYNWLNLNSDRTVNIKDFDFRYCEFDHCILNINTRSIFSNSKFTNCHFIGDFTKSIFNNVYFKDVHIRDSKMLYCSFRNLNGEDIRINNSDLSYSVFDGARLDILDIGRIKGGQYCADTYEFGSVFKKVSFKYFKGFATDNLLKYINKYSVDFDFEQNEYRIKEWEKSQSEENKQRRKELQMARREAMDMFFRHPKLPFTIADFVNQVNKDMLDDLVTGCAGNW